MCLSVSIERLSDCTSSKHPEYCSMCSLCSRAWLCMCAYAYVCKRVCICVYVYVRACVLMLVCLCVCGRVRTPRVTTCHTLCMLNAVVTEDLPSSPSPQLMKYQWSGSWAGWDIPALCESHPRHLAGQWWQTPSQGEDMFTNIRQCEASVCTLWPSDPREDLRDILGFAQGNIWTCLKGCTRQKQEVKGLVGRTIF